MLSLAAIDAGRFDAGIYGGPVAWRHDEIVLEVPAAPADRAVELLRQAVVDALSRHSRARLSTASSSRGSA
jgi:hypothetical protein